MPPILRFVCGWLFLCAVTVSAAEQIIVSGGCALIYHEKTRPRPHDRYWGNFIDTAALRLSQIRPTLTDADRLTWLVYRPAYVARGREDRVDYLAAIQAAAAKTGATLFWFDTSRELINYLNKGQDRDRLKISRFEYFGHSNMLCIMFDYSSDLGGASPAYGILHQNDLRDLDRDSFAKGAYVKSWGCHSGESYSAEWRRRTGVPMIGAIGKTDYSRGGLPFLSSPGGKWHQ
ncbi:MAG: hypothetical protein LBK76_01265 [Verrucomicrobiales bacterium]|jgi:hypothetical protein|nr:hypothetical protein [Verrucomicrobiales bacterium]